MKRILEKLWRGGRVRLLGAWRRTGIGYSEPLASPPPRARRIASLAGSARETNHRSVRVHVASYNTAHSTELCIRSMRAYAGYPFELTVGDAGSSDDSISLLRSLQRQGWLTLERCPGRQHAEWIDRWLEGCKEEFAIFVDSDVEFRQPGWLRDLVETAIAEEATLVSGEWVPECPGFVEPVGHEIVRLSGRPAPWLLLLRASEGRRVGASFAFKAVETPTIPEGVVAYDVGAYFFWAMSRQQVAAVTMPRSYKRTFHHYGGLSWLPPDARRPRRKQRELGALEHHLARLRLLEEAGFPGQVATTSPLEN